MSCGLLFASMFFHIRAWPHPPRPLGRHIGMMTTGFATSVILPWPRSVNLDRRPESYESSTKTTFVFHPGMEWHKRPPMGQANFYYKS